MLQAILDRCFRRLTADVRKTNRCITAVAAVMLAALLLLPFLTGAARDGDTLRECAGLLAAVCFTGVLAAVYSSGGLRKDNRRGMLFLLFLMGLFCETFFNGCVSSLEGLPGAGPWALALKTAVYAAGDLVRLLYCALIREYLALSQRGTRLFERANIASCAVFILAVLINAMRGDLFTVDENGRLVRQAAYCVIPVNGLLWILILPPLILRHTKERGMRAILLGWSAVFFSVPLLDLIMVWTGADGDALWLYTLLPLISCFMIFCYLFIQQRQRLLQEEQELTKSRLNAMIMQINPHFIYNTLGSIDALIRVKPEEAHRLILKFSRYLRDNYADMTAGSMIRFSEEVEHLKHYLEIEQVRFPNLKVVYQTECGHFLLPRLTLQPLVENAVRHGIRPRPDSAGTVTVRSAETEDDYVIRIEDDGVGFAALPDDGGPHIGIANARTRLAILCEGSLEVRSTPGEGTVCEIRIPRREDAQI